MSGRDEQDFYLLETQYHGQGGSAVLADTLKACKDPLIEFDTGRIPAHPVPANLRLRRQENEPGPLNDLIGVYGEWAIIVSGKLRKVIEAAGIGNVQWYPLVIEDMIEKRNLDYWIANIIGVIDCIDRERAVLDEYDLFRRLWIDPARTQGRKLFRLAGDGAQVVVHRDLKEAMEASGCQGARFVPANGFCDEEALPLDEDDDGDSGDDD